MNEFLVFKHNIRARELAQQIGSLSRGHGCHSQHPPWDSNSGPRVFDAFFWPPWALGKHVVHRLCSDKTSIHKIIKNSLWKLLKKSYFMADLMKEHGSSYMKG